MSKADEAPVRYARFTLQMLFDHVCRDEVVTGQTLADVLQKLEEMLEQLRR